MAFYGPSLPHSFQAIEKGSGKRADVMQMAWDLEGELVRFSVPPCGCVQTTITGDELEKYVLVQRIGRKDVDGLEVHVGDEIELKRGRELVRYAVRWDIYSQNLTLKSECDTSHPLDMIAIGKRVGNVYDETPDDEVKGDLNATEKTNTH